MSIKVGRYLIYGLIDPRDGGLRYIGKTHKRKEWRLNEHIECATDGDKRPIYSWINELLAVEIKPEIFILKKVSADSNWRDAERNRISFWKNQNAVIFPYKHPPQTKKSKEVTINYVSLLNATNGG